MTGLWLAAAAKIAIAGALSFVPVGSGWAVDPQPTAIAPAPDAPAEAASTLGMALNETDRMTVPIHIGGQGPYAFIVDTAATRTVISRELAMQLALKPAGSTRMVTLTGSSNAAIVHIPELRFRPGKTQDVQALAISGPHIGAHGVLGLDTLRNQRVVLDFKAQTLTVSASPRRWTEPTDPDEIVVTARRRFGQLILADSDIDGEKIDVIVDTGTEISLGNEALRRRLIKTGSKYAVTPIGMVGITGGVLTADYTRVDRLRIGRVALKGMPIAFADAYPFRKLKLRRPALLLGMDALQMFSRVTLDFDNRRASFLLPDEVAPANTGR